MRYKYWVLIAAGLFAIGIVAGLLISTIMPADITSLLAEDIAPLLKELVADLKPFQVSTALFIYAQNARTLLLSFIFSPFLCLVPVLALVLNGSLVSFISVIAAEKESASLVLVGLLPHGIFEFPAIIIGEAAALSFGATVIIALFSKERKNILLPVFKRNLRYLLLAFILLVPAAIIETFVTPLFLQ